MDVIVGLQAILNQIEVEASFVKTGAFLCHRAIVKHFVIQTQILQLVYVDLDLLAKLAWTWEQHTLEARHAKLLKVIISISTLNFRWKCLHIYDARVQADNRDNYDQD